MSQAKISEEAIEARKKQIADALETVREYESKLERFLSEIGWTKEEILKRFERNEESKAKSDADEVNAATDSQNIDLDQNPVQNNVKEFIKLDENADLYSAMDRKRIQANYGDLNKLKRDLKRRRIKYRTTKAPPLTYTEELRELINLQMEYMEEPQKK